MTYAAILADAPWRYETWSGKGRDRCPDARPFKGSSARHYEVMTMKELREIEIPAANDCALFLWVTDPMLLDGLDLMKTWGFTYKTVAFTWAKTGVSVPFPMGCGYWTRANPEMCLLGTRGKPKRLDRGVRQLITAPRRQHSRKPDEIHDRIERLVAGPYLEMFGRAPRLGWNVWGDETEKFAVAAG